MLQGCCTLSIKIIHVKHFEHVKALYSQHYYKSDEKLGRNALYGVHDIHAHIL